MPIALQGDVAVIGASKSDVGSNTGQGSAHVFVRRNAMWEEQSTLVGQDGGVGDESGNAVAIEGGTVFVAA